MAELFWTAAETDYLRRNYKRLPLSELCYILDRHREKDIFYRIQKIKKMEDLGLFNFLKEDSTKTLIFKYRLVTGAAQGRPYLIAYRQAIKTELKTRGKIV